MAARRTVARPYAEAVFRLAVERDELALWSEILVLATRTVSGPEWKEFGSHPEVRSVHVAELFFEVGGRAYTPEAENLLRLLIANGRVALLPEITEQYEELRAHAEKRLEATVLSAISLEDADRRRIEAALQHRFACEVRLNTQVNPALIAGIVILIGNMVIDGSLRGRLSQLAVHFAK